MASSKRQLLGSEYFGRTTRNTFVDTRADYAPKLPLPWSMTITGPGSSSDQPERKDSEPALNPLQVESVDYLVSKNTSEHCTDDYMITQSGREKPPQLVIRRGQPFEVHIKLNREFDRLKDCLSVVMEIGDSPKASKGTKYTMFSGDEFKNMVWNSTIVSVDESNIVLKVQTGFDAIIGKWKFMVDTAIKPDEDMDLSESQTCKISRYIHDERIYVIFNPFCKQDQVYMEDEDWRDECVMNDMGKIYTGNWEQIGHRPWNYAQFDSCVLDCAMMILDMAKLQDKARSSPVAITRAISSVVNSPDDTGILLDNWSGNYDGATAPMAWIGSHTILKEFYKTRQPVKYGQCWTFAGLTTTVCRALGIPARCVTNYASAHDCDGSTPVDVHWDHSGNSIMNMNSDTVWNFHVWNEVWMTRPDIPGSYGGWQVLDPTLRETSDGVYYAGPMPVKAIKEGNIQLGYDGPLIFAEINADKIHWYQTKDNEWRKLLEKNKVGKRLSTKRPRNRPDDRNKEEWRKHMFDSRLWYDDKERLDVTDSYKFKAGSEDERAAVMKSNTMSNKPHHYDNDYQDVKYEWTNKDNVLVGSNFEVTLRIQNTSREHRTVTGVINLRSCYYTGVPKSHVKKLEFDRKLGPIKGDDVVMRITAEEYGHLITDQCGFKLECVSWVKETNQLFTCNDDFRLRRPDLNVKVISYCKVGEEVDLKVSFMNPMGVTLTKCQWQIEGSGVQEPITEDCGNIEPYDNVELKIRLKPFRIGKRRVVASFDSKELGDVTGETVINVTEC